MYNSGPTVHAGLTKLMHDEDNKLGLRVINDAGDSWMMFGDNVYFDESNAANHASLFDHFHRRNHRQF